MDNSLANSKSSVNSSSTLQDLGNSRPTSRNEQQGLPPGLVAAEERRRQSLENSTHDTSSKNSTENARSMSNVESSLGTDIEFERPANKSPIISDIQSDQPIETLMQQNRALGCELETYKLKVKSLQEENKNLRQVSVHIQLKAEQEEEFISNTLLKKIQALKKEKENLAINYEQEEECLTNDLTRKLDQLRQEKVHLEHTLEQEQEYLVNKLMRRIEKLEAETTNKQTSLDKLRREKVELENTLEQE